MDFLGLHWEKGQSQNVTVWFHAYNILEMTKLSYRDAEQISGCQGEQWWGQGSGCDMKGELRDHLCGDG